MQRSPTLADITHAGVKSFDAKQKEFRDRLAEQAKRQEISKYFFMLFLSLDCGNTFAGRLLGGFHVFTPDVTPDIPPSTPYLSSAYITTTPISHISLLSYISPLPSHLYYLFLILLPLLRP